MPNQMMGLPWLQGRRLFIREVWIAAGRKKSLEKVLYCSMKPKRLSK